MLTDTQKLIDSIASNVSLYKNVKSPTATDISLGVIFNHIKAGEWQDVCLPIMREADKEKRSILKALVPCYTGSGTFSNDGRQNANLRLHSGFIFMDYDGIENLQSTIELLQNDAYSFAVFKSISHTGFVVVVKIEGEKHNEAFDGIAKYHFEKYGIVADQQCKAISQPRYVCYDPDLYCNVKAKLFKEYIKPQSKQVQKQQAKHNYLHTNSIFETVLNKITTDICPSYNDWLNIGFAIASEYGKNGEDYFHVISRFSSKYNYTACSKQYSNCLTSGTIKIGTFYHYAKMAGIDIVTPEQKEIAKIATLAMKGGRNKESVGSVLQIGGLKVDNEIVDAVFDGYTAPTGNDIVEDLVTFISVNYNLKRNGITKRYELGNVVQTEVDLNTIYLKALQAFPKLTSELFTKIICSRNIGEYNPLKDYFNSLQWDGVDRLRQLCEVITSDTGDFDYRVIGLQSWLLGMVETVFKGKANVLQLIFAGLQNTGKSYFFTHLLPAELRPYMAFSQLDKGKDDELLMCENLLIVDDEFSGKSKKDAVIMKRLLSAPYFNLRVPYGKGNECFNRLATLAATTNETQILNDPTGNRRNLVFNITGQFNYVLFNSIDKSQLFAQLVHMFKHGYISDLTLEYIRLMDVYTGLKHGEVSIEAESIAMVFEPPEMATSYNWLTATAIKNIIELRTVQKINITKLGAALKKLGYERVAKNSAYGYLIKEKG